MTPLLDLLASWPGAVWLQQSGTAYLFVNAAHILGIGLLLGAILPLDLRLLGFFPTAPIPVLGPFLLRIAIVGLALAIGTGSWLFTVKPREYLANEAFLAKLGLLALAFVNIGVQHAATGLRGALEGRGVSGGVRCSAGLSALVWLSVLLAGRWIGFI